MKYTFKEKQKHFADLRNPAVAIVDLALLKLVKPDLPEIKKYDRDPRRYADDILYRLLDFLKRDEIRKARREAQEASKYILGREHSEGEQTDPADEGKKDLNDNPDENNADQDTDTSSDKHSEGEQTNPATEELERIRIEKEEAERRASEAEETLEETESALEEEEEARAEAELRAEEAEAALKEEKKKAKEKPVKEKSKKVKSTQKSTGTISSTRKSS